MRLLEHFDLLEDKAYNTKYMPVEITRKDFLLLSARTAVDMAELYFGLSLLTACAPNVKKPDLLTSQSGYHYSPIRDLLGLPKEESLKLTIQSEFEIGEPAVVLSGTHLVGAATLFKNEKTVFNFTDSTTISPLVFFVGDTDTKKIEFITADRFGPEFNYPASDACAVLLPNGKIGFFCLIIDSMSHKLASFLYDPTKTNQWSGKIHTIPDVNSSGLDKPWAIWDEKQKKGYLTIGRSYSKSGIAVDLFSFDEKLDTSPSRIFTIADYTGYIARGRPTIVTVGENVHMIYLRREKGTYHVYETVFDPARLSGRSETMIFKDAIVSSPKSPWYGEENLTAIPFGDGGIVTTTTANGNIIVGHLPKNAESWETYRYPIMNEKGQVMPFGGFVNLIDVGKGKVLLTYLAGTDPNNLYGYGALLRENDLRNKIPLVVADPLFKAGLDPGDYAQSISRGDKFVLLSLKGKELDLQIIPKIGL